MSWIQKSWHTPTKCYKKYHVFMSYGLDALIILNFMQCCPKVIINFNYNHVNQELNLHFLGDKFKISLI